MAYQYSEIPKNTSNLFWVRLIKPFDDPKWKEYFPKDMEVGDITWALKKSNDKHYKESSPEIISIVYLLEDNRYCGNFKAEYFEVISGPYETNQYEIY